MGRLKKYKTDEERRLARNARRMKYYIKNCEEEKQKALKRYYDKHNL